MVNFISCNTEWEKNFIIIVWNLCMHTLVIKLFPNFAITMLFSCIFVFVFRRRWIFTYDRDTCLNTNNITVFRSRFNLRACFLSINRERFFGMQLRKQWEKNARIWTKAKAKKRKILFSDICLYLFVVVFDNLM